MRSRRDAGDRTDALNGCTMCKKSSMHQTADVDGQSRDGHRRRWGHRDRVDAGDVLTGIGILAGIAIIAGAASDADKQ